MTPLQGAVNTSQLEFAKLLLDSGASVNARTAKGTTALDLAKEDSMRELLRSHGGLSSRDLH